MRENITYMDNIMPLTKVLSMACHFASPDLTFRHTYPLPCIYKSGNHVSCAYPIVFVYRVACACVTTPRKIVLLDRYVFSNPAINTFAVVCDRPVSRYDSPMTRLDEKQDPMYFSLSSCMLSSGCYGGMVSPTPVPEDYIRRTMSAAMDAYNLNFACRQVALDKERDAEEYRRNMGKCDNWVTSKCRLKRFAQDLFSVCYQDILQLARSSNNMTLLASVPFMHTDFQVGRYYMVRFACMVETKQGHPDLENILIAECTLRNHTSDDDAALASSFKLLKDCTAPFDTT